MDIIREMVRNIAIIVVLTSLLEMLLPVSNMQRFVRVVMGLFIIITLLNPVLALVDKEVAFQVSGPMVGREGELAGILDKGKALSEESRSQAMAQYEEKLGQQVMAVAQMVPGINLNQVKVKVKNETGANQGEIKEIRLVLNTEPPKEAKDPNQGGIQGVDPVKIEVGSQGGEEAKTALAGQEDNLDGETRKRLIETIANFYSIKPEQVHIESNR
ncbi:MAG: stage III sporulation protein AF [Clostridia bacterium]|nr:stage III sporulation protein AF [Clostridia bacterium]